MVLEDFTQQARFAFSQDPDTITIEIPRGDYDDPTFMLLTPNAYYYFTLDGRENVYYIGDQSGAARERQQKVEYALEAGYLDGQYTTVVANELDFTELDATDQELIETLVASIDANKGRALTGLTVLQLTIKAITPAQDIRLHKGNQQLNEFSFVEGMSMRSIDNEYVTSFLRENDLLYVNGSGVMLTRTFAENYPYTPMYRAQIRGPKDEWLQLVERVEHGQTDPELLLQYLLHCLIKRRELVQQLSEEVVSQVHAIDSEVVDTETAVNTITDHLANAPHDARLHEVALHSLYQELVAHNLRDAALKDLTQLRSADKKHGNIADIELVDPADDYTIYQAWDMKVGKDDLTESLNEMDEKLEDHPETEHVGYVVDSDVDLSVTERGGCDTLADTHDLTVRIQSFEETVTELLNELTDAGVPPVAWLVAYTETLCRQRRDRAPVDEPALDWVQELGELLATRFAVPVPDVDGVEFDDSGAVGTYTLDQFKSPA